MGSRGQKKGEAKMGWDAETGWEARRKKRPEKKVEAERGGRLNGLGGRRELEAVEKWRRNGVGG